MAQRVGGATIKLNTRRIIKDFSDIAAQRVFEANQEVRNTILETLTGDRTGRWYKVPGTKNTMYRASAPGEPPASATGRLRLSIKTREWADARAIRGWAGSDLEKAVYLEFGTKKMLPRPFIKPSYQKALPKIRVILQRPWR